MLDLDFLMISALYLRIACSYTDVVMPGHNVLNAYDVRRIIEYFLVRYTEKILFTARSATYLLNVQHSAGELSQVSAASFSF